MIYIVLHAVNIHANQMLLFVLSDFFSSERVLLILSRLRLLEAECLECLISTWFLRFLDLLLSSSDYEEELLEEDDDELLREEELKERETDCLVYRYPILN